MRLLKIIILLSIYLIGQEKFTFKAFNITKDINQSRGAIAKEIAMITLYLNYAKYTECNSIYNDQNNTTLELIKKNLKQKEILYKNEKIAYKKLYSLYLLSYKQIDKEKIKNKCNGAKRVQALYKRVKLFDSNITKPEINVTKICHQKPQSNAMVKEWVESEVDNTILQRVRRSVKKTNRLMQEAVTKEMNGTQKILDKALKAIAVKDVFKLIRDIHNLKENMTLVAEDKLKGKLLADDLNKTQEIFKKLLDVNTDPSTKLNERVKEFNQMVQEIITLLNSNQNLECKITNINFTKRYDSCLKKLVDKYKNLSTKPIETEKWGDEFAKHLNALYQAREQYLKKEGNNE